MSSQNQTINEIKKPSVKTYWISYTDDTKTEIVRNNHYGVIETNQQLNTTRPLDTFTSRSSWVSKLQEFNLEPNDE